MQSDIDCPFETLHNVDFVFAVLLQLVFCRRRGTRNDNIKFK